LSDLPEPSPELAAKLLGEVRYEERLMGFRMTPMAGALQHPIYGLRQAVGFLQIDSYEEVIAAGPRGSVPYVDPKALRSWVGHVFGDTELAEALGQAIDGGANYVETIRPIIDLLQQRLTQCEAVLADRGDA
jgi:hypothetical protein